MFNIRLKELRTKKNLLQKDIADVLKISTSAYGFYEQGKRQPDYETLKKLADYFNVSIDYLLGKSDKKETIENSMPEIPEHFTNPDEAREYVNKHKIFGANGFRPERMCDEEILEFANALLEQMELLSYKYKK